MKPGKNTAALLIAMLAAMAAAEIRAQVEATAFPSRPEHALTGSEFLVATWAMAPEDREFAILDAVRAGNVPSHMRQLVPIRLCNQAHCATFYVVPDYLSLGSDEDHIIMPMAPRTAMAIAREFGFTLPTPKLVDVIYANSPLRLAPQPMPPGAHMDSNAYYRLHHRRIRSQLPGNTPASTLVSGHKKDIVLTPQLRGKPDKVAIYGWHSSKGKPIQPLSLFHHARYVDYSHGVRLVSRKIRIDGREVDLAEVFADEALSPLVSDGGPIHRESYLHRGIGGERLTMKR